MHLQVVCDKDLLFLDVFTGYTGSVHDSRVFPNSDLHGVLESDASKLPPEYHMIWDSAYLSLRKYLLVPFRDNGHLTPVETAYNRAQARTRVDVERAIGLLKGKFRRLKDLKMTNIREVPMLIFSACVLHNFIIENGVDEDGIDLSESEDEDEDGGQCGGDHCMSATQKRLEIANVLS
ncbi:hypothetical protein V1264_004551 [Littorina saxatilis]|uniref:DDE Tnp4 domain-containing protein n=1 Tax=Littorina saxatilis TaxID=31220 RepID=A0AAN9B2E6_9CAEN